MQQHITLMDIYRGASGLGRIRGYHVTKNTDTHTRTHALTHKLESTRGTQQGNPLFLSYIHYTASVHARQMFAYVQSQIHCYHPCLQITHPRIMIVVFSCLT